MSEEGEDEEEPMDTSPRWRPPRWAGQRAACRAGGRRGQLQCGTHPPALLAPS